MGPEVTIKIELLPYPHYNNIYQIDFHNGTSGDRVFIKGSDLFDLIAKAQLKAQEFVSGSPRTHS